MQVRTTRKKTKSQSALDIHSSAVNDLFPQARYFQVHFDYLHELLNQAIVKIDTLNKQVNQLEQRLANSNTSGPTQRRATFDSFTVSHTALKENETGLSNSSRTL